MVLVGVSIEDNPAQGGFGVFYATLDGSNKSVKVNTIPTSGKNSVNPSNEDLEGLGALGNTVYAISEGAFGAGDAFVKNPDAKFTIADIKGNRDFGDDAGFDIVNKSTAYNIQGNDEIANGAIGSQLYKITKFTGKNPQVKAVGKFSDEFADGLAIFNNKFAIASDLELADGDGDELYVIRLKDGKITDKTDAVFTNSKGGIIDVNGDSGIDFASKGAKVLYTVEDESNDIFVSEVIKISKSGKFVGKLTGQIKHAIINDGGLPEAGIGDIAEGEFEGFAVIDISTKEFNSLNFQTNGDPQFI